MKSEQLLLLKHESIRQEINALFELLASNPSAKQSFINNPAGVMRAVLSFADADLECARDDTEANRLLFSVVSNPKFFDFVKRHQDRSLKGKAEILKEFADAFLKFGDQKLVAGLLSDELTPAAVYALPPIFVFLLIVIVAFTIVVVAVDHHRVADDLVSVGDMRSLAELLTKEAKEARQSGKSLFSGAHLAQIQSALPQSVS
jgi:hypothetical protein